MAKIYSPQLEQYLRSTGGHHFTTYFNIYSQKRVQPYTAASLHVQSGAIPRFHKPRPVVCYIDDILISSAVEESHMCLLSEVCTHLESHGFRLKLEKCQFLLPSVEYLGHVISKDGIKPVPSKVEAITKALTPTNLQQLRSFLGLIHYYGKFIPNLSTLLHPLNALLQLILIGNGHQNVRRHLKTRKTK